MTNVTEISSVIVRLVVAIICIAIPPLLNPLITKLIDIISAKVDSINDEKKKKIFDEAVEVLNKLTTTVVESLEQECASEIRKKIADGEATRDDLCALKDKAIETIESQLSESITETLKSNINDVSTYISDLVSEKVRQVKVTNTIM